MNIYYGSKKCEQEFSTADLRDSRSYSSRFSKSKARKNNPKQSLPFFMQKAAIVIQRFWRHRMSIRRKFYQKLTQQLYHNNQALVSLTSHRQSQLSSMQFQLQSLQHLRKNNVNKQTQPIRHIMKNLAKDCVALTFKLEKSRTSQQEIEKLVRDRLQATSYVDQLRKKKLELQAEVIGKFGEDEQMILREIKEANTHLLRIVSDRNVLKQKLKEKKINYIGNQ